MLYGEAHFSRFRHTVFRDMFVLTSIRFTVFDRIRFSLFDRIRFAECVFFCFMEVPLASFVNQKKTLCYKTVKNVYDQTL